MPADPRMMFLGFGKYAREDKIYALEPIAVRTEGTAAGPASGSRESRTRLVASRTERTILADMGQERAGQAFIIDEALDLAERLAKALDAGQVDLRDLGRRARHLLEQATEAGAEREPN
jgi:hypothetical protein